MCLLQWLGRAELSNNTWISVVLKEAQGRELRRFFESPS